MNDGECTFLGHPVSYWVTLDSLVGQLSVGGLLKEIAKLRAKVSFYESRLKEMELFRQTRYLDE